MRINETSSSLDKSTSKDLPYITVENKNIYDKLFFTETGEGCAPYLGQKVNIECFKNFNNL